MRVVVTFLLLFGVWFLWSGHTETMLLGFGVGSSALVTWLAHRMRILDDESFPLTILPRLVLYVPWVFVQIVKANLAMLGVLSRRDLPIAPQRMMLRLTPRTDLGRAIVANTITITPGTVSLDIHEGTLYVHALTDAAASADEAGELDRRVARLEGSAPPAGSGARQGG